MVKRLTLVIPPRFVASCQPKGKCSRKAPDTFLITDEKGEWIRC